MKNEKKSFKINKKIIFTPKKILNTEENKNYKKFKPYYPDNNVFKTLSISKNRSNANYLNNKTNSSDKKKNIFPLINIGRQLLSKQGKSISNYGFQNFGNLYEKINLFNPNERDNLMMEIYHSENEMKKTIKEINNLKTMFETLEKENISNKDIISKLLQKKGEEANNQTSPNKNNNENSGNNELITISVNDQEKNDNNLKTNNTNNTNNDIINSVNKKSNDNRINKKGEEEIINNKLSFTLKKSKNKLFKNYSFKNKKTNNLNNFSDREKWKISVLKKQLSYYKRSINSKNKEISSFKNNNKIKKFNHINELIQIKYKILEELIDENNEIQNQINLKDEIIINLGIRTMNLKENILKKNNKIEYYKKEIEEIEKNIKFSKNEKNLIEKIEKKKEEQDKEEKNEIESLVKEEKNLEKEYEEKKKIKNEHDEYESELSSTYNEEKKYKNKYDLGLIKYEKLKNKNEKLIQVINEYQKERQDLLEKSKIPQRRKEKIKEMENEIKKIEDEIDKYIKNKNAMEQKAKEYNNKIGNDIVKNKEQFEEYKKENEELTNKIKRLGNEFKIKVENKNKKENELKKINEEYNSLLEQIKLLNDDNYNDINDISELQNGNKKLKEENDKIKKIYEQKKKILKDIGLKSEDMELILNDINDDFNKKF